MKTPWKLIGDNAGMGYDCFWDLVFEFKETLTFFKFESFD